MAGKQKYYVVWEGGVPGIYTSWAECEAQTKGYPNARYKSFKNKNEAILALRASSTNYIGSKSKPIKSTKSFKIPTLPPNSISVDAACSGNPGLMEYRGVYTDNAIEIFKQGPFKQGTNNIGEFLALVHALAMLSKKGDTTTSIFSDSRTAMAWVRNKKVKTTLKKTAVNAIVFDLIDRALSWLNSNQVKNPILKWDTKNWGEIPADFGRK